MPPPFKLRRDDAHWSGRKRAHNAKQNIYNIKQFAKQGKAVKQITSINNRDTYGRFRQKQCLPRRNNNFVSKHYRKTPAGRTIVIKGYCRGNPGN